MSNSWIFIIILVLLMTLVLGFNMMMYKKGYGLRIGADDYFVPKFIAPSEANKFQRMWLLIAGVLLPILILIGSPFVKSYLKGLMP